jgi:uncharacterized protein YdeI (YjbR/CyaY-like superfamily)
VPPVIPDATKIRAFRSPAAFEAWLRTNPPIRSASAATLPEDLRAAIEASPKARKMLATLGKMNLFAMAFRTGNMKTPAGRAKKIAALVEMLARGETIVPEAASRKKTPP